MNGGNKDCVTSLEELDAIYGPVSRGAVVKEVDHIHPVYQPFIELAPFVILATAGPGGLDVSPRGDAAGFVAIEDERTLLMPDRRGNNRTDSLRNIVSDPRVALLFIVPGVGETLRVNGRAEIVIEPGLLERFAVSGKVPRSVLRIWVESVFFQCSKALVRSRLWDGNSQVERTTLPSAGRILGDLSRSEIDGASYDRALPERTRTSLY